ncbi:MAG: phosphate ABC transporter substrate-binding protein [Bacteroidales bacterium]|jgi:phosphate transport system substrate-binding protein|nr:phosphate ABC transporter substrate-binding protein [Bacteroidales bacterium]MDD4703306.1 phosphate ABC transporter substrate-binding protein [Bacteroidales bacterium]MDX9797553.1 phosphate ABC transporter substrate-binding protein [Bacteroidales bacterium]
MNRRFITLTLALMLLVVGVNAQKIKGSDSVLPLSQKLAEAYAKSGGRASVTGGGSGVGIAALMDGSTDIAQSSRKMKFGERAKLIAKKKKIEEVVVAYDALAVVVNPNNKVSKLTRQQLEDIFTGKITNWKQVGGDDMRIIVYSRETSSGTYEFFKELVLKNKNYKASVLSMPATGAIIQSIKQTKGAIGYVGLAYLNSEVKTINVSFDEKNFYAPTLENSKNGTYPIVRPLLYYYDINKTKVVNPFKNFVLSAKGQSIVSQVGYIPVK